MASKPKCPECGCRISGDPYWHDCPERKLNAQMRTADKERAALKRDLARLRKALREADIALRRCYECSGLGPLTVDRIALDARDAIATALQPKKGRRNGR